MPSFFHGLRNSEFYCTNKARGIIGFRNTEFFKNLLRNVGRDKVTSEVERWGCINWETEILSKNFLASALTITYAIFKTNPRPKTQYSQIFGALYFRPHIEENDVILAINKHWTRVHELWALWSFIDYCTKFMLKKMNSNSGIRSEYDLYHNDDHNRSCQAELLFTSLPIFHNTFMDKICTKHWALRLKFENCDIVVELEFVSHK